MAEESISIEPLPPSYSISISSSIHHQTATIDPSSPRNNANASRRLNAGAPEFIPTRINSSSSSSSSSSININNNTRSSSTPHSVMHVFPVPPAALFHHHVPVHNFKHQQEAEASPQPHPADHVSPPTINGLSEDVFHKILNQASPLQP
ncbi:hypothetical protein IFM89_039637 [Coptis chinensis]|uniref:Uncharacterized protein n=1 Tax=Coptis chinensis TaxID=261450 RepID=A0A835LCW7_9MAGN|nr:hypothetical protein IFM89_039637 [Coptis chinensis]